MEPAPAVVKLAVRRPDWELPELHAGLQLAPADVLWDNKRSTCAKCGRSRAHYCYDCLEPLVPFPHVDLPFRVSIVTHHEEKASKNTGVQVAILAAGQVDLHSMLDVPRDVDPSRCAVLFPSDDALEVSQLEPDSIDRLFIIDSRKKAGELVRSDVFRSMRAVKLRETRSAFWRFHTKGVTDEGVCTIEALYFFLNSLAKEGKLTAPRFAAPHAFDNLLWYFCYQHQVVAAAAQRRLEAAQQQQQQAEAGGSGGEGQGGGEGEAGQKKGGKRAKQQQQHKTKGQGGQGQQQSKEGDAGSRQQQEEEEEERQERQHVHTAAEGAPQEDPQEAAPPAGEDQPAKRARV